MKKEEVESTNAMVNLDPLGLGPTAAWLSDSDKHLAKMLAAVAQAMTLPISALKAVGSIHSVQFTAVDIPRITMHTLR
jgi:hypothetical protein